MPSPNTPQTVDLNARRVTNHRYADEYRTVCGLRSFARVIFDHAPNRRADDCPVCFADEAGAVRIDHLAFLAAAGLALVPVGLLVVFLARLAVAVAGTL